MLGQRDAGLLLELADKLARLAGKGAAKPPPKLDRFPLARVVHDVIDSERLAVSETPITFEDDVPAGLIVRADPEQLYRILSNLVRNGRQALEAARGLGRTTLGDLMELELGAVRTARRSAES